MLEDLIKAYLADVQVCLEGLELTFGRSDLLRAWRSNGLDQSRRLLPEGTYELHGTGCSVTVEGRMIDIEFAGPGEAGFDAWRLWKYARATGWAGYTEPGKVEDELRVAVERKLVTPVSSQAIAADGNCHLVSLT